jgi:hypothetical protein
MMTSSCEFVMALCTQWGISTISLGSQNICTQLLQTQKKKWNMIQKVKFSELVELTPKN